MISSIKFQVIGRVGKIHKIADEVRVRTFVAEVAGAATVILTKATSTTINSHGAAAQLRIQVSKNRTTDWLIIHTEVACNKTPYSRILKAQ
jgi:hypothetical protein